MTDFVETIIVGGGQGGLATSYHLTQAGHPHLVFEQAARPGHTWRKHRWDSFTLVTPNWATNLPGAEYRGDDADGFLPRPEIIAYFERYEAEFNLPVRHQVLVTAVDREPDDHGYGVTTSAGAFRSANVVIGTGIYQQPKRPAVSAGFPAEITQLHSSEYHNPEELPPGGVLVVGSAQSGCQIAEELYQSGRKVYLCVGRAGRVPRRYRGHDYHWWLNTIGLFDQTVDKLPSPRARFEAHPHLAGKGGGHSLNLHQFARDGVVLMGHLLAAGDGKITLAPDLKESLAAADQFEADFVQKVDAYIAQHGMDLPEGRLPQWRDGFDAEVVDELDLASAGIRTVIWATGYRADFSMIHLPVLDGDGHPVHQRGVSDYPGLYFVGFPWLHKAKSGILYGVGEDAAFIASQILSSGAASVSSA
jgi:putative flavoprotein involved in K+ transport